MCFQMDGTSYEALLSNTKLSLCKSLKNEVAKQTFSVYFTNALEDCATCIYQVITVSIFFNELAVNLHQKLQSNCLSDSKTAKSEFVTNRGT